MHNSWRPVLPAHRLGRRPLGIWLDDQELVLFRQGASLGARPMACPHRGMRLDQGRCTSGGLRCAYHGWLWNSDGMGRSGDAGRVDARAQAWNAVSAHGLIWLAPGTTSGSPPQLGQAGFRSAGVVWTSAAAPLRLVLDNLSEAEHVSSVHWMGFSDPARTETRLSRGPHQVEVHNEGPPSWAMRLVAPLMGASPLAPYQISWVTRPSPPRIVFEHGWSGGGQRLRVETFLVACTRHRTDAFSFVWTQRRAGIGRVLDPFQRAWLRWELGRDAALLAQVDPSAPLAHPTRFDAGVLAARALFDHHPGAIP